MKLTSTHLRPIIVASMLTSLVTFMACFTVVATTGAIPFYQAQQAPQELSTAKQEAWKHYHQLSYKLTEINADEAVFVVNNAYSCVDLATTLTTLFGQAVTTQCDKNQVIYFPEGSQFREGPIPIANQPLG